MGGTEATQNVSGVITGPISFKGAAPHASLSVKGFEFYRMSCPIPWNSTRRSFSGIPGIWAVVEAARNDKNCLNSGCNLLIFSNKFAMDCYNYIRRIETNRAHRG